MNTNKQINKNRNVCDSHTNLPSLSMTGSLRYFVSSSNLQPENDATPEIFIQAVI